MGEEGSKQLTALPRETPATAAAAGATFLLARAGRHRLHLGVHPSACAHWLVFSVNKKVIAVGGERCGRDRPHPSPRPLLDGRHRPPASERASPFPGRGGGGRAIPSSAGPPLFLDVVVVVVVVVAVVVVWRNRLLRNLLSPLSLGRPKGREGERTQHRRPLHILPPLLLSSGLALALLLLLRPVDVAAGERRGGKFGASEDARERGSEGAHAKR